MLDFHAQRCQARDVPTRIHVVSMVRLKQAHMEHRVILDLGREFYLVSSCPHLFKDGERPLVSPDEIPMLTT